MCPWGILNSPSGETEWKAHGEFFPRSNETALCRLSALSGHLCHVGECPLLRGKQTLKAETNAPCKAERLRNALSRG